MRADNQSMASKDCFRSGNNCLKRGMYDASERMFRQGINLAGFNPSDFEPVTEEWTNPFTGKASSGYLVQNHDAALNYWGLSLVLYRRAVSLAESEGITDRVRELIRNSEASFRKSRQLDINLLSAIREDYSFEQGLETELRNVA